MRSILDVRSTGLGSASRELKRHSKVKVPKVSRTVRKIKRKLDDYDKRSKPKKAMPKIMSKEDYIKTIPESTKRKWASEKERGGLNKAYKDAYSGYKISKGIYDKPAKYNKWGDRIS